MSIKTPEGKVKIDSKNQHLNRFSHIGKIQSNGQFEIVWSSKTTIKPEPFPKYKTETEWNNFLEKLYETWGNSWIS